MGIRKCHLDPVQRYPVDEETGRRGGTSLLLSCACPAGSEGRKTGTDEGPLAVEEGAPEDVMQDVVIYVLTTPAVD
ncbi:hypothetical protein AVEN_194793-1 [Araneus ventricosus]|uniref:Uncharacterized protein n=1 Tax=Araneus ventricosus TaxID=182803 RepID=A0A4Y2B3A5_ARAVE|nr:hypothetical protein AVEN_194792-1 [Araneus ventricosus]GBL86533.1 hypothetical protein AVEN_194793-1 [Araneus ventricosus]